MSKSRAWIFIILGVLLAAGTGLLVYYTLQQQSAKAIEQARTTASESATVATMRLPVAARQLEVGSQISAADYVMKDFPLDLVPITAISTTVELDNKTVIANIAQGSTFQSSFFLGAQTDMLSQQIEAGHVVFAFPMEDLLSKSDVIRDGDHIDLLLTIDNPTTDNTVPTKSTLLTVQNIKVLHVMKDAANAEKTNSKSTALLLSVKPDDAIMIKYVKDSGGVIDFALRSTLDQDQHQAPAISYEEFAKRYNIR